MNDLTKLTPAEIEQRYQTRDGQSITRAVIDGYAIYIDPSRSPSKYQLNSKGMLLNDREHSLDLVLKPEYRDEITDSDRYQYVKDRGCVVVEAPGRNSLYMTEAEIDEAIRTERKPHIVRRWWVNHYKDGFSCCSSSKELADSGAEADKKVANMPHGPRTHVERRDVYSDDSVVVTREEV